MFAELLGKEAGYCQGKGGSMHIADPETGNLGANAIVGGGGRHRHRCRALREDARQRQVAVCFFGDGALGQGLLYEAMNMASLWKLPVIYICENNLYGEYTPGNETIAGEILARPRALGIHAESVDGQDVQAVIKKLNSLAKQLSFAVTGLRILPYFRIYHSLVNGSYRLSMTLKLTARKKC